MKTQFKDLLKKSSTRKVLIGAACFLVIAVGGSGAAYAYYQTPVAYLSLDINPSVELGVNAFDKVVTAEGYNEDGQTILAGLDVTGSTVNDAVQSLIESADEKGYIAEDGSTVISLTSETNDSEKAAELQASSETGAKEALEGLEKEAVVQKDNVAIERRDEARELGITPGKLNLINKLQAVDPDATIEEYKDASVKDIMKSIKENRKEEKSDDVDTEDTNTDKVKKDEITSDVLNSETSTKVDSETDAAIKEIKKNDNTKSENAIDKKNNNTKGSDENTTELNIKKDIEEITETDNENTYKYKEENTNSVQSSEKEMNSNSKDDASSSTNKTTDATTSSTSNKKSKN